MFVCLSSGSTPRYREDVLRALAQPWGSFLQFRYLKRYLAPGVLDEALAAKQPALQALVAYIDQSDSTKAPEILPCRFATIREVTEHGTTVSLQLELKEFAFAEDLIKFNTEIQMASSGTLPAWQSDAKLKGYYWIKLNAEPTASVRSTSLGDWERIVTQLAARKDFKDEGCFYTVAGIVDVASGEVASVTKRHYEFTPAHEYEVQLYHYYPTNVPLTARLTLTTTSQ